MNARQVDALNSLMWRAKPPARMFGDTEPAAELHVALEVAHGYDDGNTYEARLWTMESYCRFPDCFYLRSDGKLYVLGEDEVPHEVLGIRWVVGPSGYACVLNTEAPEPALEPLSV